MGKNQDGSKWGETTDRQTQKYGQGTTKRHRRPRHRDADKEWHGIGGVRERPKVDRSTNMDIAALLRRTSRPPPGAPAL